MSLDCCIRLLQVSSLWLNCIDFFPLFLFNDYMLIVQMNSYHKRNSNLVFLLVKFVFSGSFQSSRQLYSDTLKVYMLSVIMILPFHEET